ncbi:MAG: EAL domain-containing protein [Candidatus Omnitrophica bacterium]|nr:EAL domain-containing protein [Candidatus Omnitrophota bacterium]
MIKKANNRKSILLVDDDHAITQTLSMLLETRGYDVAVAHCGREVFEKISDTFDVILLDLILPDCGGFDVCRKLRENRTTKQIPIIILSAKLFSEDIVEGLYLGADDYLTKPFEYEELVARMEAVMRRRAVSSDGPLVPRDDQGIICEIRQIVDQELIVPFFQPIFLLNPFALLGFEALGHLPASKDGALSNPELLFKCALRFGCYHDLEMVSWKKAVAGASEFIGDKKLFLNCNPCLVEGQKFSVIESLFDAGAVDVDNVILEITERSAISDFKIFYEYLARYREYGFKFAVDDVGGGYASLEAIVATRPEVVKIDRHIVNNLENDPFKRSVVKFIVAFCKENRILSVAEGVERKEDLKVLIDLGVDAGQGYYLCKPTAVINLQEITAAGYALVQKETQTAAPFGRQPEFPAPYLSANGSLYITGL